MSHSIVINFGPAAIFLTVSLTRERIASMDIRVRILPPIPNNKWERGEDHLSMAISIALSPDHDQGH